MSKLPNMKRDFRQNTQHFSDTLTKTTRPGTHNPEKGFQTMNQFNTRPQTHQMDRQSKEPKFRQSYQNNNIRIKTCMSQLKYISNSTPIEIFPNEVVFKDIQINQTYEMLITVRNLQKQSRRIRVIQPQLSVFRCDYDTQGAIPAGLTMNLLIQFETNSIGDFHDQLKIITDDHFQYTIPLHAYDKTPEINFIDYINLGFLQTGKEVSQIIEFKNVGKKQGHIDLRVQQTQKNMMISPSQFVLNPYETETVKLTFKSYENGNFKSTIQVYVENFIYHKNILVNAIYLDYSRILIDKSGGEVKQLDFGTMYYGESKEIETNLVNNSPNDLEFKVSFKNGQIHMHDYDNLMTPNETGHEQTQKIISCYPQKGSIKAYQQTSIVFVCKSKVSEEIESWTRNYALGSKDDMMMNRSQQYTYTAVFEFDQKNDDEKDPVLFLTGKAICPEIKLDRFIFDFNECKVNGNKDIILQIINKNEEQTLDMQFQMIPFFSFTPNKFKLHPNQYKSVIVSFRPKNLGKFNNSVYLYLMNSNYKIELKVIGDCNRLQSIMNSNKNISSFGNIRSQSSHTQKRGGLEQLPKDFLFQRNYVIEQQEFDILGYEGTSEQKKIKFKDDEDEIDNLREQRDQYLIQQFNKQKYNEYLTKSRKQREDERIKSAIQNKMTILEERRRDQEQLIQIDRQQVKQDEKQQDDKKSKSQRNKYKLLSEDQMGEAPEQNVIQKQLSEVQLIKTPRMVLSKQKDQLYVTKPIQNYEPTQEKQLQDFKPKSTQQARKIFPEEPKSFAEERDINKELNGLELQQIFAGPKVVDFENIFIKSKNQRTFWIRNDLKHSIQVRLEINKDELKQTNKKVQIIPSSQIAGFTINFRSVKYQQFKGIIKYVINERHSFNFCVKAHVEPVLLEPSNNHLKFNFQEGNNDMTISQSLTIRNNGNSEGKFNFIHTEQQIFTVYPKEGIVNAKSQQECIVTYKPMGINQMIKSQETSQFNRDIKIEDEKLVMKVEDGEDQIIKCQGQINEAKCQLKDKVLDLGQIPICERVSGIIWLKNKDKYSAVYQIDQECIPPHIEIHPMKGKLNPDQMLGIKVLFLCREEIKIRQDIIINLRGGQPLRVDFNVQTILPKVRILENDFDFGEVTTLGNSGFQYMTIVNESDIDSVLGLDLRERPDDQRYVGIECLEIKPVNYNKNVSNHSNRVDKNDESSIMMSVNYDKEIELLNNRNFVEQEINDVDDIVIYNKKESMDDDMMSQNSQQEDNQKDDKVTSRTYKIKLRANSKQVFSLKFTPNDVRTYNIELPLTLFGYGRLESLSRMIRCEGLKPKFLMEPKILDFKKKIIRQVDKAIPSYIEVTLNNPDLRSLYWKIDTQYLEVDNVFQILPNEGRIDGGQTIIIKASFQPYSQGVYERTIPVYLDKNYSKPAMEINLKGQGTHPKLIFDRKEVILPIVPLNIQSKCVFRVLNDGYENLMLQYNIIQEFGNVGLELDFPEGRNLGITKNKLKVEAKFNYKKPISFSVPVEFYDDQNRSYQIIISGTADNCLMTNYQFIQRYGLNNDYILAFDEMDQIQYVENDVVDSEDNEQPVSNNTKREGQQTKTKTISMLSSSNYNINLLGYNPIQQSLIDRSADQILRWLNYNVLIHGIQNFPGDIIQSNGSQVFELLSYLTGKSGFSYKVKIENNMKKNEKIALLLEQYQNLVIDLKEKNALLNTIRPCYLLSYQDYNSYKKSQDQQFIQINEKNFNYLSSDNWITLIYQIIKIFYLNRISNKNMKPIPNYNNEERQLNITENFIEGSNIIGVSEGVLLRWLEANHELYTNQSSQSRTILNMEQSLKDCLIYAYCIYNYVGESVKKHLNQMRTNCMSEEDYKYNADRLMGLLQEIGLQTHFQQKDFTNPSLREQLLFICQLYHSLPHYQPKGSPIVFSCTLMEEVQKQIELINNSNRVINYWVKYEGSQDFIKESDNITIQPRSVYKYKVKFVSRLSKKVTGRLTFTNKKESNAQAAALVFELQSNVIDRNSLQTLTMRGKMYSIQETKIDVKNIFVNSAQDMANFEITVINDNGYDQSMNNQKNKQKSKNEKGRKSIADRQQSNLCLPPAFFCTKDNIRIRKGQTMELVIQYMPFQLCSHKCKVVFSDENVGEFQYEIIGQAMLPDPIQDIRLPFQLYVDTIYVRYYKQQQNHEQLIQFKNEMMNSARRVHEQRVRQSQKQSEIEQLIQMNKQLKQSEQIEFSVQLQPQTSSITFPVSFTVQEIVKNIGSNQFQQKEYKKVQTKTIDQEHLSNQNQEIQDVQNIQSQNTGNNSSNKILLQFAFKKAFKDGTHFLVLMNENKTDIRVYKIVVSVYPRAIRATLEMKCPVGEEIKQDIPIINGSDSKDWLMKIQWIQDYNTQGSQFSSPRSDRYFSGSKELIVKKKTTSNYTIYFKPLKVCHQKCKLIIANPINNDQFEYDLIGIGDEPLSQDHIVIDCLARQSNPQTLLIHNPYKDKPVTYEVESDLQIIEDGKQQISIAANKSYRYQYSVHPKLGGVYAGSIHFYEMGTNKEKYIWYTMVVNAERPRNEKQIDLQTSVRKPVMFEICIKNPLNEGVIFDVCIDGEYLSGNSLFSIEAHKDGIYELMFSPLKVFNGTGSIAFMNEKLGELQYMLNLTSDKANTIRLPVMKAEIGKSEMHQIVLENPSDKEVQVNSQLSNNVNFKVSQQIAIIQPYSSETIDVVYYPSEIDKNQQTDIVFKSDQIGDWHYMAYGVGVLPTDYEVKDIHGQLNDILTEQVDFKNPFKDQVSVSVSMCQYNSQEYLDSDIFKLLLKKKTITLQGFQSLIIPFSFQPKQISQYTMCIVVVINESIEWKYPIKGITESCMSNVIYNLVTKARVNLQQDIQIQLPGLPYDDGLVKQLRFKAIIQTKDEQLQSIIQKDLQILGSKRQLNNRDDYLVFNLKFNPMKPYKIDNIELAIDCEQGGRWKYRINLESLEPEPDDIICIESPLNKTTSVSFRLSNKLKVFSYFQAYFSKDSDNDFNVSPKEGELEPFGREPKIFTVSFSPLEYGKSSSAKLIIETEALYWSFVIKGSFPQYKPPERLQYKVDDRLQPNIQNHWDSMKQKRNYLQTNLKKELSPKRNKK